jgi:hypothetical protein
LPPIAPEATKDAWTADRNGVSFKLLTNFQPSDVRAERYRSAAQEKPDELWLRTVAYDQDGGLLHGWHSLYARVGSSITIVDFIR